MHDTAPDLRFGQPERRSFLRSTLPVLGALSILAIAVVFAMHFFPATTVNITHVKTTVVPTRTVFSSDSIVAGPKQTQDELFIAETLTLDNQLRQPMFLDKLTLTITTSEGELVETAVRKQDFSTLRTSFPALETVLDDQQLLPDDQVAPGKQKTGVVLFGTRLSRQAWQSRQSAVLKVDLYHLNPVYLTIPKE